MLEAQTNASMTTATPFQIPKCPYCESPLRFLQKIWKMGTNGYVCVFECPGCHKLIWDD